MRNAVDRVLDGARSVGEGPGKEYCWPVATAADVIGALADLQQAVLGFELWSYKRSESPRVLGWSGYEVSLDGRWVDIVEQCRRAAIDEFPAGVVDGDQWVNLTWISETELHLVPDPPDRTALRFRADSS
jgi:hypothetical protein